MSEKKKLRLHKHTLRDLTADDLRKVVGGERGPTVVRETLCEGIAEDPSETTCQPVDPTLVLPCQLPETTDC